jgi:drug/metabolite transporter (DMT)-like permease
LSPSTFWLSLTAAVGYSIGAVFIKNALARGMPAAGVNFYCNLAMALLMQVLWFLPKEPDGWPHLWKPLLCSATFYLGQVLTFLSLARSQVSVATPVLGAKVIFVVLFLAIGGAGNLTPRWWVAAALTTVGIWLVSARRGFWREAGAHTAGVLAAFGAAATFGLTDALFQLWVGELGPGVFAPVMFAGLGLCTMGHFLLQPRRWKMVPPTSSRPFVWTGVALLAVQCMLLAIAIGVFADAAGANIVYGLRAVFGVLLAAWIFGGSRKRETGRGLVHEETNIARKLFGSILVFAAVALVLL